MSTPRPLRFGILSAASIAREFLNGLDAVPSAICTVVASRDIDKARRFATLRNIQHACTYEQLLQYPIDAVYIPLPTALAPEWAIRCAKAGKHIIVDKPLDAAQAVHSIIEACRASGVVFLDGTHFVHALRTKTIQNILTSSEMGSLMRIVASFSFPLEDLANDIRSKPALEPQTCIGDLGWYTSRAAVTYFGADLASKIFSVSCKGLMHPQLPGVINSAQGVVEFGDTEDERVALCFDVDFRGPLRQNVEIVLQNGTISIPDFVVPPKQTFVFDGERSKEDYSTDTEYTVETSTRVDEEKGAVAVYPKKEVVVVKELDGLSQHSHMVVEFCRMVEEKDMESAQKWANETLVTQRLVDSIYDAFMKGK